MELSDLNDIQLLALLIAGECDGEPLAGQVAVAATVIERYRRQRDHYGRTIRDVMLKPAQYSTFNGDTYWRTKVDRIGNYTMLAELAIERLLNTHSPGATHFCRHDLMPKPKYTLPQYSVTLGRIGQHIFYSEF